MWLLPRPLKPSAQRRGLGGCRPKLPSPQHKPSATPNIRGSRPGDVRRVPSSHGRLNSIDKCLDTYENNLRLLHPTPGTWNSREESNDDNIRCAKRLPLPTLSLAPAASSRPCDAQVSSGGLGPGAFCRGSRAWGTRWRRRR